MKPLILRDVTQSRGRGRREVTVLRGACLEVGPGERIMLEGPSGSGKTTLLAVAAGMLTPQRGEVTLVGRPLMSMSRSERARLRSRQVGFVFQRSNLLSRLTVLDNVILAARLAGMSWRDSKRQAAELLEQLEIDSLAERYSSELSGGEEQRVAVARALAHRPAVVLADEPTGNLDHTAGRAVAEVLSDAARLRECAVVLATHDARLAFVATRRVRLQDGQLVDAVGSDDM